MDVNEFDFELPEELIAQSPLKERSASRLLVLNKETGEVKHQSFKDLIDYLSPGDVIVLNDTRVIPARLFGAKADTGAKIEVLLLKQLDGDRWETLVKPGKKMKPGSVVTFGDGRLTGICEESTEVGGRIIRFQYTGIFNEILDELGQMPLPPYIKEQLEDSERYQTVFAKNPGSAAAPTAGLHFTEEYLQQIRDKGIHIAYITLHVGLGTFRPVQVENVLEHKMHTEYFEISQENADRINAAKASGNRVVAVGTTATRTLETVGGKNEGKVVADSGWTDIFIYPGYHFTVVDGLLTNFHLPKSTLVMLVSSLAGKEPILNAYREAVEQRYRFFSFGDAMLII
ncbi:tRNA preQ1(34) S-adenosylmethionine ribosyltransferase-isomerase QueA [Ammoniphilus sp. CFH 90114]|uniref:tRNA preQ1(34) S-adenosylmethionine ribosyltransferase-isomerase QueA n=1 Tax=Ammoniphilus sp. CFH 90114 TaxID=2493665 RepID=UPI00100E235F|nr:tRNA preQ1(34) S-adenosylmethionine ribosyltransferase-isomerase QueA [Ammoniphilus sp. CFH 90114]RXT14747.1 tRNA preQ1(34) S-adenosylmethionine ribosyltransferase-isomerase QueA [Ammoniphilus sp. CFH 90114]